MMETSHQKENNVLGDGICQMVYCCSPNAVIMEFVLIVNVLVTLHIVERVVV